MMPKRPTRQEIIDWEMQTHFDASMKHYNRASKAMIAILENIPLKGFIFGAINPDNSVEYFAYLNKEKQQEQIKELVTELNKALGE